MIPYTQHQLSEEDIEAANRVLRSDRLTQGEMVPMFEHALAAYVGAKHVICVSSGTAALTLAISTRYARGTTVPVTPLTFVATAAAIVHSGSIPRFVDIGDRTLMPSIATGVAVDFAGALAPIESGSVVDAAHSFGARVHEEIAAATCYSFHPAKTITTGEGGAVATNDAKVADVCRALRDHGRISGQVHYFGLNLRMTEIAAALGLSQLKRADEFVKRRRRIATAYWLNLPKISELTLPQTDERHAWHLFVLRVAPEKRQAFRSRLHDLGIGTQIHYPLVYEHPVFASHRPIGGCPTAEYEAQRVVSIPLYPSLTDSQIDQVIEGVKQAAKEVL